MAMGVVYWLAGWTREQAEIGGLALSTTSLAVVYAVLLETGGSGSRSGRYGDRVIEPEIKLVFAALFVLYLGGRANSQAVLPAFVLGLAMSSHYDEHRTEQKRLRVRVPDTLLLPEGQRERLPQRGLGEPRDARAPRSGQDDAEVRAGHAAELITRYARGRDADLVVVGPVMIVK
jgi:nucleotide-binding universal stress UspA family protein